MPPQRFFSPRVAFQTCPEIALRTADIEIQARLKPETAEFTHLDSAALRQVENRDVGAALQHNNRIAYVVLPHKCTRDNLFARPAIPRYTCHWPRLTLICIDSHPRGIIMATTKKDLVDRIAESTGTTRTLAKVVVQGFFDEVIAELDKGNRLEFRDFGVFETKTVPARTARNPKTSEKVEVPA